MAGPRIRSVCLAVSLALLVAAPARASDDEVKHQGSCSGGPGDWTLVVTAAHDATRIRFEIEDVDPGERWQLFLSVDGKRILTNTKRTDAEGEVFAKKVTADGHGSERIKASGVNIDSGGSCEGSLTY